MQDKIMEILWTHTDQLAVEQAERLAKTILKAFVDAGWVQKASFRSLPNKDVHDLCEHCNDYKMAQLDMLFAGFVQVENSHEL